MKPCDICGRNDAVMKVRQLAKDGTASEIEVCSACAQARGLAEAREIRSDATAVLADLRERVEESDEAAKCPACGLSFADFKRKGQLGCADCYAAFRERLLPIVRRLHGAVQHVGKTPSAGRKLAQQKLNLLQLKDALSVAVTTEDYEKAAALRDQLKRAEDETGD
ncbi:MAG: UvrB/UvrC motif-containing protein [bacterium]